MYAAQSGDPKETPSGVIERDLSAGKIDAAIVWGPLAGMLVSQHPGWTALPFKVDPKIKFDYEMSMGVRFGEGEWKDTLDGWIGSHRAEIQGILTSYHIPLLELAPAK
jgi:ABC-type amino acid transport substrate-binding protein